MKKNMNVLIFLFLATGILQKNFAQQNVHPPSTQYEWPKDEKVNKSWNNGRIKSSA